MNEGKDALLEARRNTTQEDRVFRRFLRNVEFTQEDEIDCSTCLEQVAMYVDQEHDGANVAEKMPELHLHLVQCGDCYEEYEALRDLVELDLSSGLPDKATLLKQLEGQ
jgi:hypothetical protein